MTGRTFVLRTFVRFVFAALLLSVLKVPAKAWIFQEIPDKTVTVNYKLAVAANTSTAAVVIDLSSPTASASTVIGWPHTDTGFVGISSIRMQVDRVFDSTYTVKLGVVNFVNSSTGSVTWFQTYDATKGSSSTVKPEFVLYTPNYLNLRVIQNPNRTTSDQDGLTPYLLSNDTTSGSTTYQTDVYLPAPGPNNQSPPGVGDVVMTITNGTSAISVMVNIQYFADKR